MSERLHRAILVSVAAAVVAGLLQLTISGSWRSLLISAGLAWVVIGAPWLIRRGLGAALQLRRAAHWKAVEGRHYSFAGQSLTMTDDGRYVWMLAADLQRVLRSSDKEDVIAARHAGRWRRDARGKLQLRVDTVVQVLSTCPNRMDPQTLHLHRYLEREVLFPAHKRRQHQADAAPR